MKPIINIGLFLFLLNYSWYSLAQGNLVPNYSMEVYDTCPNTSGQISFAGGWFQPCKSWSSTEYFNACDSTMGVGVPTNSLGYQNPNTGNAYAGIIIYYKPYYYREFIEIKLTSPLLQNMTYCISYYISLAEFSNYAINNIGCLLTVDSFLTDSFNQEISFIPQIENAQGTITDTMNWVLISGAFVANGGEIFLTVGNFKDDLNTNVDSVSGLGTEGFAYYYIDDVSVTLCDTTVVEEKAAVGSWQLAVHPNPANNSVTITAKGGDKIIITDIAGRKIKEYKISNNQLIISTDEYDDGVYFLTLYNDNRLVAAEKFCVAK